MQFAYEYPTFAERLALIDSGGLGREVHLLLRAATLPGSEIVLPLLAHTRLLDAGAMLGKALDRLGLQAATDIAEMARGHASLNDAEARHAFIQTMRAVLDPGGQRVNATDRLYLAAQMPSLVVWGRKDTLIPVEHADVAHAAMPGSRLEIFDESGHFPQLDEPARLAKVIRDWIDETEPARIEFNDTDLARLREQMLEGSR
jgi:pimeloyl-ACP methyl ester carboxylesterase